MKAKNKANDKFTWECRHSSTKRAKQRHRESEEGIPRRTALVAPL